MVRLNGTGIQDEWLRVSWLERQGSEAGWSNRWSNVIRQQSGDTPRIMCRDEVGQSLQGRVRFVLRVRLQHVNNSDCYIGAISARRRGLGIFAVASLTRMPHKHAHAGLILLGRLPVGRSVQNSMSSSPLIVQRRAASWKREAESRLQGRLSPAWRKRCKGHE